MTWRTFLVMAAALAAVIVNGALVWYEQEPSPEEQVDLAVARKDRLLGIAFNAGSRIRNFKAFGFPEETVDLLVQRTARLEGKYKEHFQQKLVEHADEVGWALCAGDTGLPQRYAALSFLVKEENEVRKVIPAEQLTYLEEREWWGPASGPIADLYNEFERDKNPKEDSTVMGVGAILMGKEEAALAREAPWGRGGMLGTWSYSRMLEEDPAVEKRLVDYFSLMHLLTELANASGGICQ